MEGQPIHKPVLLREVVELLGIRPGMKILDATVGLGGHSRGMLEAAGGEGQAPAVEGHVVLRIGWGQMRVSGRTWRVPGPA